MPSHGLGFQEMDAVVTLGRILPKRVTDHVGVVKNGDGPMEDYSTNTFHFANSL